MNINFLNILFIIFFHICTNQANAGGDNFELEIIGLENITDTTLRQTIEGYYIAEANNEWSTTYSYRTKKFKSTVPVDVYSQIMPRDVKGWQLEKIEILGDIAEDNKVKIKFFEKVDTNYPIYGFTKSEFSDNEVDIIENTIWIMEDGEWRAFMVGIRNHFSLNESF